MKRVFSTPHLIEAQSLRDLLGSEGIESFLNNENHSFFAQGAVATGVMPEVWVTDSNLEKALAVKEDWLRSHSVGPCNEPE